MKSHPSSTITNNFTLSMPSSNNKTPKNNNNTKPQSKTVPEANKCSGKKHPKLINLNNNLNN